VATTDLRALKTLLWAKRRRLDGLTADVRAATASRDEAAIAHQDAVRHQASCAAQARDCEAEIDRMMSSPSFVPQDAVTMRHVLDGLHALAAKAAEAVQAMATRLAQAEAALATAALALQRAQQQIDQLEERRRCRLVALDQEAEDTQDEESEEAAVARRLAQARAATTAHGREAGIAA